MNLAQAQAVADIAQAINSNNSLLTSVQAAIASSASISGTIMAVTADGTSQITLPSLSAQDSAVLLNAAAALLNSRNEQMNAILGQYTAPSS